MFCQSLPDSATFTAKITYGSNYGDLYEETSGRRGKEINRIPINFNGLHFIAGNLTPQIQDSVIIVFTCSEHGVLGNRQILRILPQTLQITISPPIIKAGESADFIIKKINSDGSLSDLPSDTHFNVSILNGQDYGKIFVPEWNGTTNYAGYVLPGFQFVSNYSVSDSLLHSIVLIETATEPVATKIQPDNFNGKNPNILKKQNSGFSVHSTKDFEYLWGEGTVAITKSSQIRAYFEKPTLSPGDTVNVIVKHLDSNGDETDYPQGTNFEVAVTGGCGLGEILNSEGARDVHFPNIQQPIRFVVANPIVGTDTVVVLTVGAPDINESAFVKTPAVDKNKSTSKTSLAANSKTPQIVNKKVLAKAAHLASCVSYTPIYADNTDAAAGIGKTKIKITLTNKSNIWPFLPPTTKGASRGADRPGYNPNTSLKVTVKNGETPLSNTRIKITLVRIEGTGGHYHTDPILEPIKCGKINNYDNPHSFLTDNNGEILITQLRSSEVCGKYRIIASLESNSNIKDTTSIIVSVLGLTDFRSILYNGWELVGDLAYNSAHKYNHYCDQQMGIALADAIIDYNSWNIKYSQLMNTQPTLLQINDMSLINGGDFDYLAKWDLEKKHQFHRVGFSVDIDRTLDINQISKLESLIKNNKRLKGKRDSERPMIHFEFKGGYYK